MRMCNQLYNFNNLHAAYHVTPAWCSLLFTKTGQLQSVLTSQHLNEQSSEPVITVLSLVVQLSLLAWKWIAQVSIVCACHVFVMVSSFKFASSNREQEPLFEMKATKIDVNICKHFIVCNLKVITRFHTGCLTLLCLLPVFLESYYR